MPNVGEDVDNRNPHSLLMAMQNSAVTLRDSLKVSYKTEHTFPCDPADPAIMLLGIYPKELKTYVHT